MSKFLEQWVMHSVKVHFAHTLLSFSTSILHLFDKDALSVITPSMKVATTSGAHTALQCTTGCLSESEKQIS